MRMRMCGCVCACGVCVCVCVVRACVCVCTQWKRKTLIKFHTCLLIYSALLLNIMNDRITCNYARCAIHLFTTKYQNKKHTLPRGSYTKILADYNQHFSDYPALKVTYKEVANKFSSITKMFSRKWHPNSSKQEYLCSFAIEKWTSLESSENTTHSIRACKACETKYHQLSQSFPLRSAQKK